MRLLGQNLRAALSIMGGRELNFLGGLAWV